MRVFGDRTQFDVAVLGGLHQHLERFLGGNLVLVHQDAVANAVRRARRLTGFALGYQSSKAAGRVRPP
jgi:hypothetical protein